jgi:hypothetical protein
VRPLRRLADVIGKARKSPSISSILYFGNRCKVVSLHARLNSGELEMTLKPQLELELSLKRVSAQRRVPKASQRDPGGSCLAMPQAICSTDQAG